MNLTWFVSNIHLRRRQNVAKTTFKNLNRGCEHLFVSFDIIQFYPIKKTSERQCSLLELISNAI